MNDELTICSVSFHSKPYLDLNIALTRALNPAPRWQWLIAENTPPPFDTAYDAPNVTVIPGHSFEEEETTPASFHHALGLNRVLSPVTSRFVLILDPDFFIISRDWIVNVLDAMRTEGLAFFGAPWHPRWFAKYRYFPCVHCLFIDLGQVPRQDLDFMPGYERPENANSVAAGKPRPRFHFSQRSKKLANMAGRWIGRPSFNLLVNLEKRSTVGQSRDTGIKIHERYSSSAGLCSACLTPVYRFDKDYPVKLDVNLNRALDRVLPDHLSYSPKKRNAKTAHGFREAGVPDATAHGWEEFMWKGRPFGFHLRSFAREKRDGTLELATLSEFLNAFQHLPARTAASV